jgi:hypothetical protein
LIRDRALARDDVGDAFEYENDGEHCQSDGDNGSQTRPRPRRTNCLYIWTSGESDFAMYGVRTYRVEACRLRRVAATADEDFKSELLKIATLYDHLAFQAERATLKVQPGKCREQATQMRIEAAPVQDAEVRQQMFDLADQYEQLAASIEARKEDPR